LKLRCAFIPAVLAFPIYLTAGAPHIMWTSGFPSAGESAAWDCVETPDGGYISVGEAWTGNGGTSLNIAAFREDGTVLWERTPMFMGVSVGYRILPCAEGYLICGSMCDSVSSDGFLMKIDTQGNTLWTASAGYEGDDCFRDMCIRPDGGTIAVGHSFNDETRDREAFAVCFSDSGAVIWRKRFVEAAYQTVTAIAPDAEGSGDYLLTGTDGSDVFLMKINDEGEWQWKTKYFQEGVQSGSGILCVPGGGYLVTGSSRIEQQFSDALMVFFDQQGVVLSDLTWGEAGPDIAYMVMEASPAGFVILTNTNSGDGRGYRPRLLRFDPWFSKLWDIEIADHEALCYSIRSTTDGGFIISGKKASTDSTATFTSYLVKLSPEDLLNWE